ncbi:MAG: hypothetical protein DRP16_02970 [Candidatus Aenigmatarchaeota archaeon]|nr:MAG: hypothetical protein DRP16_02970 [Candidatus Aenigmarchaeota archaeon]
MAEIRSIDLKNNEIIVSLRVSKEEYALLHQKTDDILIIPAGIKDLNQTLTTGKLGNSNRLMLPKKVLEKNNIPELDKKVKSKIFLLDGNAYLLVKLKEVLPKIPFQEVKK